MFLLTLSIFFKDFYFIFLVCLFSFLFFKEFFQNLPEWEDRLKCYNEACFYLADVCEPMMIAQMNHEKERINHKFKDLLSKYNSFEDQLKGEANQAYKDGVTEIAVWLTNVNTQLTKTVPCTQQALQNYVSELDVSKDFSFSSEFKFCCLECIIWIRFLVSVFHYTWRNCFFHFLTQVNSSIYFCFKWYLYVVSLYLM